MGLYTLIHTKIEKLPIFRKFARIAPKPPAAKPNWER